MNYDDYKLNNGGDIEETDGDFMETIEREYYKNFMLTADVTDRGAIIKAKLELYDEDLDKFLLLGPVVLQHHLNMLIAANESKYVAYYISEECMFLTSMGELTEPEMYDCNKPQKSLNDLAVFLGDQINELNKVASCS